jgi:hypothetical protein
LFLLGEHSAAIHKENDDLHQPVLASAASTLAAASHYHDLTLAFSALVIVNRCTPHP